MGMLDIGGRPLLEHIIINLQRHGFDEIAINLHFQPDQIKKHFGNGSRWRVSIEWSQESALLGTAGGVKRMAEFLRERGVFLIHYGDILTNQDFESMLVFHRERQALVTLLLHQRAGSNSAVRMDGQGCITRFLERPAAGERPSSNMDWVNSGICLCAPEFLDHLPPDTPCDLPRDIFPGLVASRQLYGFPLTGNRCAIDSPARLEKARAAVLSGSYSAVDFQ